MQNLSQEELNAFNIKNVKIIRKERPMALEHHKKIIPINVDRNVSPKEYVDHAKNDMLVVSSLFFTFQGEGPFTGHPAVFLRLAGCNIGEKSDCDFCDTQFALKDGQTWGIRELSKKLEDTAQGKASLLVVTGGEPLLQEKTLSYLIQYLQTKGTVFKEFQIETNGSYLKDDSFLFRDTGEHLKNVHVVISPKSSAALGKYPKAKDTWYRTQGKPKTYLKYVLSSDPESRYHQVPSDVLNYARDTGTPVYVSGMAHYLKSYPAGRISSIWHSDEIDFEQTGKNYRHTAQYALAHGLIVSYQQHLFGAVE